MAEPSGFGVVRHLLPGVASDGAGRDRVVEADVDCDIFRHDSGLYATSMRVLTSASEDTWRLDIEIGNPFRLTIDQTILIGPI